MPRPGRRSVRLRAHNYQGGLYFVTICTQRRQPVFGEVVDGVMHRSVVGDIAHDEWLRTERVRPSVVLDAFVVMPDHVHLLFGIAVGYRDDARHGGTDDARHGGRGVSRYAPTGEHSGREFRSPSQSVGAIVRGYKGAATAAINRHRATPGRAVWQRGYYDRVVRTDREAEAVRRYIAENPARWAHRPGRADGHRV